MAIVQITLEQRGLEDKATIESHISSMKNIIARHSVATSKAWREAVACQNAMREFEEHLKKFTNALGTIPSPS